MKTIMLAVAGTVLFLTAPIWAPLYCILARTSLMKACRETV